MISLPTCSIPVPLGDRHEPAIGVNPADAARNRAMFGESVIKSVAGHREIRLFWFGRPQEAANYLISFASIKIVSIDGGERLG